MAGADGLDGFSIQWWGCYTDSIIQALHGFIELEVLQASPSTPSHPPLFSRKIEEKSWGSGWTGDFSLRLLLEQLIP